MQQLDNIPHPAVLAPPPVEKMVMVAAARGGEGGEAAGMCFKINTKKQTQDVFPSRRKLFFFNVDVAIFQRSPHVG